MILLSGDIELNPGPTNKSMYPCAMCDLPVTWVFVVTIVVCGITNLVWNSAQKIMTYYMYNDLVYSGFAANATV